MKFGKAVPSWAIAPLSRGGTVKKVMTRQLRRGCLSAALYFQCAGLACSALVGCGADQEPQTQGPAPTTGAPVAKPAVSPSTTSSDVPLEVVKLFSAMDAVGEGSEAAYQVELRSFLVAKDPMALLAQAYEKMPARATGARWKAAYAAGQIRNAASVAFLERIAAGPEEMVAPAPGGGEGGDQSFSIRHTAAIGVVHHYLNGVEGADASLNRLLRSVDPRLAQLMALELFGEGKLSDSERQLLSARGVSTKFRKLSDAEFAEIRRIDPEAEKRPGADTKTREINPVPALDAK